MRLCKSYTTRTLAGLLPRAYTFARRFRHGCWNHSQFIRCMEANRMTDLRIFQPDEETSQSEPSPHEPREILPFDRNLNIISGRVSPRRLKALNRARVLFENQTCPFCKKCTVEPLELDDAILSRKNHRAIPGTASIVGFHCNSCESEWPVYETVRA